MDHFVVNKQNIIKDFVGRETILHSLRCLINSNSTFCVYGDSGVGKTYTVRKALEGLSYVEYSSDVADRIKNTQVHVLIDDGEVPTELPLSRGALIVISRRILEGFDCIHIPHLDVDDMMKIRQSGNREEAIRSNGNIRRFLFALENFDTCTIQSKTPKEFISELLCRDGTEDPKKYIGSSIAEHGYSWGVVHENYVDCQGDLEWYADIANYMSLADIEDDRIYRNCSSVSTFSLLGIVVPAIKINHTLERATIRPGSVWTKFNNFKMRYNRYQSLSRRKSRATVDIDSLMVIYQYCKLNTTESIILLKEYNFEPADVDMMNHLSLVNKIKPRVLQNIKKGLR
jgi:hypothetical protein